MEESGGSSCSCPDADALAPAANAVESDPTDSSAAQRALAAALKSNAKAAADSDLLASLDFDNVAAGATGTIVDDTTGTKATINGAAAVTASKDGTTAVRLGSGFWLNVTKSDDSAVLKGLDAVTISYDSKSASTNQGWSVFAAPNTNAQTYQQEHYLGVMDRTTSVNVERYNNAGKRDTTGNVSKDGLASQWRHVDLVIDEAASTLYIDGEQAATVAPADGASFAQLTDILGADGGVLQIGKANWSNGEYFSGLLDNFKIWGKALSDDELGVESAKTDYAAALAIPAQITGDLPSTVLGKTVTWSATGDGAKLVAADGKVTQPKSGEKAVKVKLTATIDGVDKAITAESEILNNGGEIASYVKDVDRSDQNGAKYDPLAYNDDRRADSLYVAAKAADGSKWETLNRSQSILSVKWDGSQSAKPNAQMGSPAFFRAEDGTLGVVSSQNNATGAIYVWDGKGDGATFTNAYTTAPVNPDGDGATSKAGIQIVKTLTGRPIAAGDFKFTMAPADDVTKAKFGDTKAIKTTAADLGKGDAANTAVATTPVATGLEFALEDVGKTYTFKLSETKGDRKGYTYDETEHTLTFTTADNGNGTLSVTVALDGKEAAVWTSGAELTPVSVGFANSYSAGSITVGGQGGVALTGTKQLTGRPMAAGEFHFNVTNAKDQTKPAAVVATGTNAADGTITFTGIGYTTEKLNNDVAAGLATVDRTGDSGDVYAYTYNVSEDAAKNDKGISIIQGEQVVTVKVTDNRAGKLSAEVVYPQDGMVFKNAYGTGEGGSKQIAINGTKVLDVKSGDKAPDIAGKYTFTLTGSEDAPMPATTTATNDAAGNISFGEITYTTESVFGAPAAQHEQPAVAEDEADTADAKTAGATDAKADEADAKADDAVAAEAEAKLAEGESAAKAAVADEPMAASAQRSKTFTYAVTETGSVAGVTNDPVATKTIAVTVIDNGDGTLTVDKQAESDKTDFTFTNTYSVKPFDSTLTGEGGFTITKTLDGRDLREGEFEFALASQAEGEQTVVTAKNDASGKVAFPAISFNAPGEYRYRLAEVDGGLGGVTYDTTVYDVTATVVDNGDGTLGVTWSVSKDGQPLEGKEIVFVNSYKAAGTSITFNAAKVLTGRDLKKGEFAFELRGANGKVLQTVKNGAPTEGGCAPIAFDPITYDEPGTHDYSIVEVKGDAEGVTYDETVFTYHVVVTDDGNGQLKVEWTEGKAGAPVFQNVYVKPEDPKPADPAKPADPGNGGSGDKLIQTGDSSLLGIAAAAVAGALVLGVGIAKRRKSE